ncbi:MAG: hypothetical protein QXF15_02595 [Candidatus Aenigmatarchaeota archaeon]
MYILYVYKFKINNKKILNTIKRRFYYNYKKINPKIIKNLFNKSQFFIVNENEEKIIDKFLKEYLDWIEYYKLKVSDIQYISS